MKGGTARNVISREKVSVVSVFDLARAEYCANKKLNKIYFKKMENSLYFFGAGVLPCTCSEHQRGAVSSREKKS